MPDMRITTHRAMRSLVQGFGCYDAVAEVLNARWRCGVSKGTISKKMAAHLDWTLPDMIALQDAAAVYPVTQLLMRQMEQHPVGDIGCLVVQSGVVAKECGEAVQAILDAARSSCAGDRAQALIEVNEAIAALQVVSEKLAAGAGE